MPAWWDIQNKLCRIKAEEDFEFWLQVIPCLGRPAPYSLSPGPVISEYPYMKESRDDIKGQP